MTGRPTHLAMAERHCPHAVTLAEAGAPRRGRVFEVGTACHDILEAMCEGRDIDATIGRLVSIGRDAPDTTPPLLPSHVAEGSDLAHRWAAAYDFPAGAECEIWLGLREDGTPTRDPREAVIGSRIDLLYRTAEEDPLTGESVEVINLDDYKTSWRATEAELETVQRRVHACLGWAHFHDAGCVRVGVLSVRRLQTFRRDFWRGTDEDEIERWTSEILAMAVALRDGPRRAHPGAGCIGCPYVVTACEHGQNAMSSAETVTAYAAATAVADELRAVIEAQLAAVGGEIEHDGTVAGYIEHPSSVLADDAVDVLSGAFLEGAGRAADAARPWVRSLLSKTMTGVTAAKAVVKLVHPDRGTKALRDELADRVIRQAYTPRFAVWKASADD